MDLVCLFSEVAMTAPYHPPLDDGDTTRLTDGYWEDNEDNFEDDGDVEDEGHSLSDADDE